MTKPAFDRNNVLDSDERKSSARKCVALLLPETDSMGERESSFVLDGIWYRSMLHKCSECGIAYLVSENTGLCNACGEYLRQRIEKLHETDDAIEWVVLLSQVHNPEQPRLRHRWRIG